MIKKISLYNLRDDNSYKNAAIAGLGGAGAIGGGYLLGEHGKKKVIEETDKKLLRLGKKLVQKNNLTELQKEENELFGKLMRLAQELGTGYTAYREGLEHNSAATEGGRIGRFYRKLAEKYKNHSNPNILKFVQVVKGLHIGEDHIISGLEHHVAQKADILAHELGHTQYVHKGRSKSYIPKIAHELMPISKMATVPVGATHGFISGYKSAKKKAKGEKSTTLEKIAPYLTTAALASPVLIGEAAASRKGLQFLKNHGASKEYLKEARKNLGNAYKTYLGGSIKNMGKTGIAQGLGYVVGDLTNRKKE